MATDSFLHRWSKRKQEQSTAEDEKPPETEQIEDDAELVVSEATSESEDSELPPPSMDDVERLREGDSAAAFLAKGVSSQVKKAALRKLFLSDAYNVLDGMNDYDLDYSKTANLSAEVAETLRKWTKEKLEEATEEKPEDEALAQETPSDQPVNEGSLKELPEGETKSTHEELEDNLSHSEGQNVPIESVDKNLDGS
ncbi:hypothetical protein D515_03938 [Grimontia indica]|uniref:DUF3306 domain-containing protein n=1 Tax=Grimontia indica TaxID=1056512 RepID=R1IPQ1_9GAMM|nr:DUF3306 domain-containing protein [Grimontia indica]EOD77345.1 hypothetical protein D515_03938 [Grimontia indica]